MMTCDGIIFDVDGTLWDVTEIVAKAWNVVLEQEGFSRRLTAADLKREFGKPLVDIISNLLPGQSQEVYDHILPIWYQVEDDAIAATPPDLFEGISEVFQTLSKKYPLYIVSNCQAGYIEQFLESTGTGCYIQDHLCPGDTGRFKADNIKEIVEKHQLKNAWYIGDIQADCDATHEAGIRFVWAKYGFGTVAEPDAVINAPIGILDLFK